MGMSTAWHAGNVPVPCLDDSAWFSCQNDRLREQAACSSQSLVCSFIPSFVRSCMIHSCCDELWWIQYEFNVQHLRHSEHFPTKPPGAAQKSREGDPQHRRDRCWGEVPGWRDRFQTKRSQKSLEKCGSKSIQISNPSWCGMFSKPFDMFFLSYSHFFFQATSLGYATQFGPRDHGVVLQTAETMAFPYWFAVCAYVKFYILDTTVYWSFTIYIRYVPEIILNVTLFYSWHR